jgi:hypothetical protein
MVAIAVTSTMFLSLYGGLEFGWREIRLGRENVRATQILEEKMEVVRLYNWDQVVNMPGFIPTNFTAPFYADNPADPPPGTIIYTGTVQVTSAPLVESYSNALRMIQIQLTWQSGNILRTRQMTTFVSQYGIQRYAY